MPEALQKYGLEWPQADYEDPLQIELQMIRWGGFFEQEGQRYGQGLFHHYREAQSLAWPDDDHHRWSDLLLSSIVAERICVACGPRDSGKTHGNSKFALIDYWAFPNETLTIMSSTGIRELELRVWGDIKDLFQRAKKAHPWLAGNINQANHGIFTDNLDDRGDVRDMRRGIIAVPMLGGEGEWIGLDRFVGIKQKRRRLIGDECFPAGTMVNTVSGAKPIETILPGERVLNVCGAGTVVAIRKTYSTNLIRVNAKDDRGFICTLEHPILTQKGWVKACELDVTHYMMGFNESLRYLWPTDEKPPRLFNQMSSCLDENSGRNQFAGHPREAAKGEQEGQTKNAAEQSNAYRKVQEKSQSNAQSHGTQAHGAWRERNRANQSRMAVAEDVSGGSVEFQDQDRALEWKRIPAGLQSRCCISSDKTGNRSRWIESFKLGQPKVKGPEKRCILDGAWVESVEILKQGDSGFPATDSDSRGSAVFNLQVTGHPSYCVNGLVVHNCQFMHINYINALNALDKGDFKGVFSGNPIGGNGKALDKIAEPVIGWNALGEVNKTKTWRNRYGGITINFVGTDSPNFDKDRPKNYPYLINQDDVDRVIARQGKDSAQYWTLIMGVRKCGLDLYRVLTTEMCRIHGAYNEAVWHGGPRTKLYAIDAGFGGDACEVEYAEFAEDVDGNYVIAFTETQQVPILMSSDLSPEDQIALYVKADCDRLSIPYENVFFDAGMRATLAISMARILSSAVNAVNFGGPATDRPFNEDTYTVDVKTKERRLMRCDEQCSKFVTELWFMVRELVLAGQARSLPESAAEEFGQREWHWVPGPIGPRYEMETKPEYKARMGGESPNKADVISIAVEGARRRGFVIRNPKIHQATQDKDPDWLDRELSKHRKAVKKGELHYK